MKQTTENERLSFFWILCKMMKKNDRHLRSKNLHLENDLEYSELWWHESLEDESFSFWRMKLPFSWMMKSRFWRNKNWVQRTLVSQLLDDLPIDWWNLRSEEAVGHRKIDFLNAFWLLMSFLERRVNWQFEMNAPFIGDSSLIMMTLGSSLRDHDLCHQDYNYHFLWDKQKQYCRKDEKESQEMSWISNSQYQRVYRDFLICRKLAPAQDTTTGTKSWRKQTRRVKKLWAPQKQWESKRKITLRKRMSSRRDDEGISRRKSQTK